MTQPPPRHMVLNAFLMSTGHHEASWRLPESDPFAHLDVAHFQRLAQIAERGKLDSVFFADSPVLWGDIGRRPSGAIEPTVLLTAIAMATSRIGLVATASTTYNDPFNLARRFASVDVVSGGRAGWNIVTTAGPDAARNFGLDDQPAHSERYERADEFLEVAYRLWDSWDDDAPLGDKESGVWGDQARIRAIDHVGRHFRVRGPLNLPRSPQGQPVIVQAGSSEDGKVLASRHAEAVFTAQQTLEDAQAFYRDLKLRTAAMGRDPDSIKILPGIVPVIGATEEEAQRLERELDELIRPEYAVAQLARTLKVRPEDLPLDRQLPADLPDEDEIEGAKSRYTLIVSLARRERLTVRELIGRLGGGRGHRTFTGTPEQVADAITEWYDAGAADGFNIMPRGAPVRARGVRRPRRTPAGAARPVPRGVHGHHAARALRARAAGQPLRDHRRRHPPDHREDLRMTEYRPFGRTGLKVSPLTLGTMMFGGYGNADHADSIRIIRRALDAGINLVDTADVYSQGESETIVGKALEGRRDDVVLATKFHGRMGDDVNRFGNSRRWIIREVEDSLRRLQTDWIDLYQVHRPETDTDIEETLGALSDLVHAGKIRYVGTLDLPAVAARRGAVRRPRARTGPAGGRAAAVLDPGPGRGARGAPGRRAALRRGAAVEPAGRWLAVRSLPARRRVLADLDPRRAPAGTARPVTAGERPQARGGARAHRRGRRGGRLVGPPRARVRARAPCGHLGDHRAADLRAPRGRARRGQGVAGS